MGGECCPNCKKGMLLRKGKRSKVRCPKCGYWKFRSPNESSRGSLVGGLPIEKPEYPPAEEEPKTEEEIPVIEKEPEKMYKKDPDYIIKKATHDQLIEMQRREWSIQRMLKQMRKNNKYANLGPTVTIEGEVFDLATGERIYVDKETEPTQAKEVE